MIASHVIHSGSVILFVICSQKPFKYMPLEGFFHSRFMEGGSVGLSVCALVLSVVLFNLIIKH